MKLFINSYELLIYIYIYMLKLNLYIVIYVKIKHIKLRNLITMKL